MTSDCRVCLDGWGFAARRCPGCGRRKQGDPPEIGPNDWGQARHALQQSRARREQAAAPGSRRFREAVAALAAGDPPRTLPGRRGGTLPTADE